MREEEGMYKPVLVLIGEVVPSVEEGLEVGEPCREHGGRCISHL